MPDEEMIERIIKTSFDCWNKHNGLNYCVDDMSDSEKEFAKVHAVAIIKAMREPTEKMKTCNEEIHWGYSCHVCGGLTEGWYAMIDAVINE